MSECIRHDGHLESADPRKAGQCAACGRPMPDEPWKITPASAAVFYDRIAETLEAGWETPCNVRGPATQRFFQLGRGQYGDAYLLRDNPEEGKHEGCDATNYSLMEWHRLFLEDELDEGDVEALRSLLLEAGILAAQLFEKFSEYQRRLKEARSMVPRAPQPIHEDTA